LSQFEELIALSSSTYQGSAFDDDPIERSTNFDSLISTLEYDRTITNKIQSNQYSNNRDINNEWNGGMIRDYSSKIKKTKTILIVDDDKDITMAAKNSLEMENNHSANNAFFQVYTYNFPILALSEFKPNFYDLLLVDVEMPNLNGFELYKKMVEIDANPKICFMSAAEVNYEALREIYPSVSFGCFIKKPVSVEQLIRKVKAELE
jgi:CheY-like chemotaxis protein